MNLSIRSKVTEILRQIRDLESAVELLVEDAYDQGAEEGYDEGHNKGYEDGRQDQTAGGEA